MRSLFGSNQLDLHFSNDSRQALAEFYAVRQPLTEGSQEDGKQAGSEAEPSGAAAAEARTAAERAADEGPKTTEVEEPGGADAASPSCRLEATLTVAGDDDEVAGAATDGDAHLPTASAVASGSGGGDELAAERDVPPLALADGTSLHEWTIEHVSWMDRPWPFPALSALAVPPAARRHASLWCLTSLEPIGNNLACKRGYLVPVWQPLIGSSHGRNTTTTAPCGHRGTRCVERWPLECLVPPIARLGVTRRTLRLVAATLTSSMASRLGSWPLWAWCESRTWSVDHVQEEIEPCASRAPQCALHWSV
jgi:hypothetical protein